MVDCLERGSRKARHANSMAPNDSATTAPNLTGRITAALAASTTTPHLCLIRFNCTGGGHCIGAADSGGKIYIFDPNFGVMIVDPAKHQRSEEHTSELQSLMRISYAVLCWKKKTNNLLVSHILHH